jgi:hypothetical protein
MNMLITTEAELDERLSRPTGADTAALAAWDGDLIILGVGGKMGPSWRSWRGEPANKRPSKSASLPLRDFPTEICKSSSNRTESRPSPQTSSNRTPWKSCPMSRTSSFMAARKFGTAGSEYLTWAMNTYLPGLVGERDRNSRIVTFSTGNVYPLRPATDGGADESCPLDPTGEYAQSAVGRERMFEYASLEYPGCDPAT